MLPDHPVAERLRGAWTASTRYRGRFAARGGSCRRAGSATDVVRVPDEDALRRDGLYEAGGTGLRPRLLCTLPVRIGAVDDHVCGNSAQVDVRFVIPRARERRGWRPPCNRLVCSRRGRRATSPQVWRRFTRRPGSSGTDRRLPLYAPNAQTWRLPLARLRLRQTKGCGKPRNVRRIELL